MERGAVGVLRLVLRGPPRSLQTLSRCLGSLWSRLCCEFKISNVVLLIVQNSVNCNTLYSRCTPLQTSAYTDSQTAYLRLTHIPHTNSQPSQGVRKYRGVWIRGGRHQSSRSRGVSSTQRQPLPMLAHKLLARRLT